MRFRFFLNVTPRPWALAFRGIYLFFEGRCINFLDFQTLSRLETSETSYPVTLRHIPEERRLQSYCNNKPDWFVTYHLTQNCQIKCSQSPDVRYCCWGATFLCLLKGIWIENHHEALVRRTEFVDRLLISDRKFQWQFILVRCVPGCSLVNRTWNVACFMCASPPICFTIWLCLNAILIQVLCVSDTFFYSRT